MINNRIKRLQKKMNDKNIDIVIIEDLVNRYYFSNFYGTAGILVIFCNEIFLLTDFRYILQAKEQAKEYNIIETKDYIKQIKTLFDNRKLKKIGFNGKTTSFNKYTEYKEKFENIDFIDISNEIMELRKVKDNIEISNIKEAQKITDSAYIYILDKIKLGMTEKEISIELEYFMKKQGAQRISFDMIVASGKRSSLPHGTATNKKLETGDFLTMDFGCVYNGYCSDMTRTIGIGKVSDRQKEIYDIVLDAQKLALKNIKPSVSCKEADSFARKLIEKKGYVDNFGHGLGHGVGLEIHEAPSLSPKSNDVLKKGMVVTVEPGIYIENFGGVRIEDMGVIDNEGLSIFTKSTKDLIVI